MPVDTPTKVLVNRLRETARRRGMTISKTRTRDPLALGYGVFRLGLPDGRVQEFRSLRELEAALDVVPER